MYDTIIIGAGMSGLAAGIRLAYYDQRVCILERHYTIGGLNSFYRLRGRNYDVGLHAVTNFTPKGTRKGPLARMLRQLRFRWEDFSLSPQIGSAIAFPQVKLEFGNDIEILRSAIRSAFPDQVDNFQKLMGRIVDYDDLDKADLEISAREVLAEVITEPLLIEMLLCPIMWYGNAREHDMDFMQFCIMFRSIFLEGFCRPLAGVRLILKNMVRRYKELGGELRLRSGVDKIHVEDNRAAGILLDDGTELEAKQNWRPNRSSRPPVGWRRCECAMTSSASILAKLVRCRSSRPFRCLTSSRANWDTTGPSCSSTTPTNSTGANQTPCAMSARVSSARQITFCTATTQTKTSSCRTE
jgi:phytoene dehydrogenase-like protein